VLAPGRTGLASLSKSGRTPDPSRYAKSKGKKAENFSVKLLTRVPTPSAKGEKAKKPQWKSADLDEDTVGKTSRVLTNAQANVWNPARIIYKYFRPLGRFFLLPKNLTHF
jgi:hypothetical protein